MAETTQEWPEGFKAWARARGFDVARLGYLDACLLLWAALVAVEARVAALETPGKKR